jgi:rfaE bifunctional protein nucleotidyltransferase chain/domain
MERSLKTHPKNRSRIVLAGGCFDLLHYGHIFFLTKAKKLGDTLILLLESDDAVLKLKGIGRPFHNQEQRKIMLQSLRMVDHVICLPPKMTNEDYRKMTTEISPQIIAVTQGDPLVDIKNSLASSIQARLIVIPKTDTPSTTTLAKLLELE